MFFWSVDSPTEWHTPWLLAALLRLSHGDGEAVFLIQLAEVGTVRLYTIV